MKHIDLSDLHVIKYRPGLESIAFQDGSYLRDAAELVQQLRDGYLNYAGLANAFAKITEKHTGIWVSLTFEEEYYNAHIYPSWLCSANPLAHPVSRKYEQFMKMGFKANEKPLTAFINDKTSKVGGFLKEIENRMVMCKSYFENKNVSSEAVASVLLHEVGHAYTFFQYSIRSVVFNAALGQASQNLSKAKTYEEVKIIFKETCDILDIDERDFIKETKNTDNRVVQFTYLAANMTKFFKMMPNLDVSDGFSQDAAEELADIFVARHGGERARMEMRANYELQDNNENNKWIMSAAVSNLTKAVGLIVGGIFSVNIVPIIGLVSFMLAGNYLYKLTMHIKNISNLNGITIASQQVKKMQYQLIERLKASKLKDDKLVLMVEEAIVYGDQLIAKLSKDDSFLFTMISFCNSGMRDARAMRFYQDQLEGLVANRLFLSASKFMV